LGGNVSCAVHLDADGLSGLVSGCTYPAAPVLGLNEDVRVAGLLK
jgi:hypothetical protein